MACPKRFTTPKLYSKYPLLNLNGDEYNRDYATPLWQKQTDLLEANLSTLPQAKRFLASALHDSPITSIDMTADTLTINVNELQSMDFYCTLQDITKLDGPILNFPISLIFHNIRHSALYLINRNNKPIPVSKDKWLPRIDEYLGDHTIEIGPSCIKIAIELMSNIRNRCFILEIKADRLEITEDHINEISQHPGEKYIPLFEKFFKKRNEGKYFDYSTAKDFIKNNLGRLNLA